VPTVVIGTAGHIDHGKTALLRALTGIDADRLPEERARGMTIDVGYAHMAFDDGVELDFVDVPGHDRLIGNMLVGAGEIDAAMLVVAADDGPRPQTLEHLELLDALGIRDGIAVVTKRDLVDGARIDAVASDLRQLLRSTWLADAPVLAVSSVTGAGIEELRAALRALAGTVARRLSADGPARLAVDRAFTAKGRGVVVTGSLRGGPVRAGDALRREPGGRAVRIREVQVHNAARDGHDGGRTALNLAGDVEGIRRGEVLTTDPLILSSDRLLVQPAEQAPGASLQRWPPKTGASVRVHIATEQVDAHVRRLPGVAAYVLLDLERHVATFAGERGILREPGRGEVVGGVVVLDPKPPKGVSRRRMTTERLAVLASATTTGDRAAIMAARLDAHGFLAGEFAADVRSALDAAAVEAVAAHHAASPVSGGLPLPRARAGLLRRLRSVATVERREADAAAAAISRVLDGLVEDGRLAREGDALRDPARPDARPAALVEAMRRLEAALSVPAPPPLREAAMVAGCPPEGIRALQADGRVVRIGADLAWAAATYRNMAAQALDLARVAPLSPAAFRDATGTSRKYVLAILEDLDRREILRRTAEGHVPGPRAPQASAVPAETAR